MFMQKPDKFTKANGVMTHGMEKDSTHWFLVK